MDKTMHKWNKTCPDRSHMCRICVQVLFCTHTQIRTHTRAEIFTSQFWQGAGPNQCVYKSYWLLALSQTLILIGCLNNVYNVLLLWLAVVGPYQTQNRLCWEWDWDCRCLDESGPPSKSGLHPEISSHWGTIYRLGELLSMLKENSESEHFMSGDL